MNHYRLEFSYLVYVFVDSKTKCGVVFPERTVPIIHSLLFLYKAMVVYIGAPLHLLVLGKRSGFMVQGKVPSQFYDTLETYSTV